MKATNPSSCEQMDVYPSSSVSRLPPELLANIFQQPFPIDFSTPPIPLLQRSIDQPLEVDISASPISPTSEKLIAAKEVLSLHNHRIRKLAVDLPARCLLEIRRELHAAFPILADVTIGVVLDGSYSAGFSEWTPSPVPSVVRCLRLLLVATPWVPGRFCNLVELFLHDQSYIGFDPSTEILLGILESSPQLAILSVANAGPRLPLHTTTLPPATRVVHLHNLRQLYIEQTDACDVGWMLIHLDIPASANVRIFVDLSLSNVPIGLVFELALPDHQELPHLTDLHCCTYTVDSPSSCLITAPNFAFRFIWGNWVHRHRCEDFMLPFLRRVTAMGIMEELSIILKVVSDDRICQWPWNEILGTLGSLRRLKVKQLQDDVDFPIRDLLRSYLCPTLRDLQLSRIVFGGEQEGERLGGPVMGKLVDYCAERDRRGNRLERLVIEAPSNAPPDLASFLVPYVDHVETREDVSRDGDVGDIEFGSRRVFDSLRARRRDKSRPNTPNFLQRNVQGS
ncbi:hypothetical protein BJ322DRAFT_1067186 [Thelephora terrestris]|uniref:Uncharacterized protein n=1 Tax=Thelephora terrestris TaxID=56493 RepID=A0A9P6L562_9AGAM|nr:hypothetical protein BJ322DRAFT_1067186 [Thelephora terrestris]